MGKVKVIINGAAGKMGGAVLRLASEHSEIEMLIAYDRAVEKINEGNDSYAITNVIDPVISSVDVVVDFTNPDAAVEVLRKCKKHGKALVTGTTGMSKEDLKVFEEYSKDIPIVLSSNMSVGMNLLLGILPKIAKILGNDYDIEIIEAHHRMKKDAPSGTAIKLAQVIAEALERDIEKDAVYTRHGIIGERTKKEIGIQTIRAGDIVGDHTVLFAGGGERIEITHKASSRDTFAAGALKAALWIAGKKPGLYDMQDVLGLRG